MMGKRSRRAKRALRNKHQNPYGNGAYQKWDPVRGRWYWAAGRYNSNAKLWEVQPKNWEPTASLYYAYGSNLNIDQMALRAPEARALCRLKLPNWKLVFRGVADIAPEAGAHVEGGLWRITGADEAALDRYEGVTHGLYDKNYFHISIPNQDGTHVVEKVLFYVMVRDRSAYGPTPSYLATIRTGYADFGCDPAVLDAAVEAVPKPAYTRYYAPVRQPYASSEFDHADYWANDRKESADYYEAWERRFLDEPPPATEAPDGAENPEVRSESQDNNGDYRTQEGGVSDTYFDEYGESPRLPTWYGRPRPWESGDE